MQYRLIRYVTAILLMGVGAATWAKPRPDNRAPIAKPIIGDFAAEIRRPDGHIDIAANIAALKSISANTYFYLIWHSPTDWDDLPAFASAAEKAKIDVWVYIIPWSETPLVKKSWGFSEPYRTDYVRWAQEIARVSLEHKNIVGYVIDDFYTNSTQPDRFTVPYVRKMVDAGKAINPKIKFYPLVYFQQPWDDFTRRFPGLVDGVVAAYPKSRVQVENALMYLNDQPHGVSMVANLPRTAGSSVDDKGVIWGEFKVARANRAGISFYFDDSDMDGKRGYHTAIVRVAGEIVWQRDTAIFAGDHVVNIDLSRAVRGQDTVKIELGILEEHGVSKYPVTARFDDIRLRGFDTDGETVSEKYWNRKATGSFEVELMRASDGKGEYKLPMILMPAGESEQHEKRYPEPGTPRNIANKLEMSFNLVREGKVEGVVTYCLPKAADDPVFRAARFEYNRAADALRRDGRDR
jgi:hypothetical protein